MANGYDPQGRGRSAEGSAALQRNKPKKKRQLPVKPDEKDERKLGRQTPVDIQESPVSRPRLEPRREPPVPVLQRYGYHGTMKDFTQRLSMATVAHESIFGYRPTPGLAFDIARSEVPEDKFSSLFQVPKMGKNVRETAAPPPGVKGPAGFQAGLSETERNEFTNQLLKEASDARKGYKEDIHYGRSPQNWYDFMEKRGKDIDMLEKTDPDFFWRFQNVIGKATVESKGEKAFVETSSVLGGSIAWKSAPAPIVIGARGLKQIYTGTLLSSQAILVDIPRAGYLDALDLQAAVYKDIGIKSGPGSRKGSYRPKRLESIPVAMGKDYYNRYKGYIKDPSRLADDPGYIFLDALGLVTLGYGSAARLGAVRNVGRARVAGKAVAAEYDVPALIQWEQEFRSVAQKTQKAMERIDAGEGKPVTTPGLTELQSGGKSWEVYKAPDSKTGTVKGGTERSPITRQPKTNWEKFSEERGYTPQEISEYYTEGNLRNQGRELGLSDEEIRDIAIDAKSGGTELFTKVSEIPGRKEYLSAALKRQPPGQYEMKIGKATEYYPLSENPFIASVQGYFLNKGQRHIEEKYHRMEGDTDMLPVESLDGNALTVTKDWYHRNFSFEARFRRRLNARGRYEEIIRSLPKQHLEHVVGRSLKVSDVFARFPDALRLKLSKGENKAIEVLATDARNLEEAYNSHVEFHQDMIKAGYGVPGAHEAQLASLKLAKKILDDHRAGKSSKRFSEAYRLTKEITALSEAMKIDELGLLPITAENRIVKHGMVLRGETMLPRSTELIKKFEQEMEVRASYRSGLLDENGKPRKGSKRELNKIDKDIEELKQAIIKVSVPTRLNEDAFYFKSERKARSRIFGRHRVGKIPMGEFGMTFPQSMPELNHWFTAQAMVQGDTRIDIPSLAAENFGRTLRAVMIKDQWKKMWDASVKNAQPGFIPIRNVRNIDPALRSLMMKVDQGSFNNKDAALLPEDSKALLDELFPDPNDPRFANIKDEVQWIDPAIVGEIERIIPLEDTVLSPWMKTWDTINDPLRFTILYARPAYFFNFFSNAALGVMQQGHMIAPNFVRALQSERLYGKKASDTLRALTGEGRSKSYYAPESYLKKVTGPAARFWSRVTDEDMRTAALIHELRRRKFDIKKLNDELSTEDMRIVTESAERANKAMVQFDNLLPIEKQLFRHIVFVYPWVSRSTVWSLRTVLAHPIKTNVLVELGKMVEDTREDTFLKYSPEWFKRTGYVVYGFKEDGNPIIGNPSGINSFSTMSQMMNVVESGFTDVPFTSGEDILGPQAKFMIHGFTGKDEFGNDYPGGDWMGAAKELLYDLPQLRAAQAAQNKPASAPTAGVDKPWGQMTAKEKAAWSTSRASGAADIHILEKRERAALERTVFTPMWQSGMANFFQSWTGGGLSPKVYDKDAAVARYWKDQGWEKQQAHSKDLQRKALKLQAELVGKAIPKAVKDTLELSFKRDVEYHKWQVEHGREPNMQVKNEIDLKLFEELGLINENEKAVLTRELKAVAEPKNADSLRAKINKIAGAEAYIDWDRDVRMVASFHNSTIQRDVSVLEKLGLGKYDIKDMSENEYKEVGRKMLDWDKEDRKKRLAITEAVDEFDKDVLSAEYRVWLQNRPPLAEGLPSAPEFATARFAGAGNKMTVAIRSRMFENWSKIGSRDRILLGRPTDPKMLEGWADYYKAVRNYKRAQAPGQRTIEQSQKDLLAQAVEGRYPGFIKDYNFAKRRLVNRITEFKQFKQSQAKTRWNELFKAARAWGLVMNEVGQETYYKETWKDNMIEYEAYWSVNDKKWAEELNEIKKTKPTFLFSLLNKGSVD